MMNNGYGRNYMPSYNNFNQQSLNEQIDYQINQLQQMKNNNNQQQPIQQPTNLTQNFQISPTNREVIRYANSINDVERDMVIGETPYFSKDMSVVWVKNLKGEIKTYELTEIVPKDEKDFQIEMLKSEIEELKGRLKYEPNVTDGDEQYDETSTTKDDETARTTTKKSKSTSIQRVSTSKK